MELRERSFAGDGAKLNVCFVGTGEPVTRQCLIERAAAGIRPRKGSLWLSCQESKNPGLSSADLCWLEGSCVASEILET